MCGQVVCEEDVCVSKLRVVKFCLCVDKLNLCKFCVSKLCVLNVCE